MQSGNVKNIVFNTARNMQDDTGQRIETLSGFFDASHTYDDGGSCNGIENGWARKNTWNEQILEEQP